MLARAMASLRGSVRLARLAPLALAPVLVLACGSPPPPAQPAPAPASSAPAAPAPATIDLSPAPEPAGLVAFARATKPSEAIKVIGSWLQMPMPGASEVGQLVTGEATGNLIDLDQPIDFAMVLRGMRPSGAMSAAIRSLDEARLEFSKYKLVPGDNGVLRIEGLGKPDDDDQDGDEGSARACELVPSVAADGAAHASGAAGAMRLVCAESQKALDLLAPWLARTTPRTTYPADMHVELRAAPVRELVNQGRGMLPLIAAKTLGIGRTGVPEFDEAFRATIDDLVDFTSDVDTIALDAMVGEPQAQLTMTSRFRGASSTLARLALAHPERAAAPPAAFWKLPADSDFAFFHGDIESNDVARFRDHVADLIGAILTKLGLDDVDRKAVRDVAASTLDLLFGKSEYASGLDVDGAEKAIASLKAAQGSAGEVEAARVAAEKMAGWMVVGLDAPASSAVALEKQWAATWARPGLAKWMHAKAVDGPPPIVRMAPLPKGITGKDAAHLEVVTYLPVRSEGGAKKGKKPPPGKPLVLHVLVVPDGSGSWLVAAADEGLAVAKAKEVLAGGGLPARAGLASMKDAHVNSGGFVTARTLGIPNTIGWVLAPDWSTLERDPLRWVAAASDRGATPVTFAFAAQAATSTSPAGTFTATATIPKGAIESIVRMAIH
jgi:hypothetical protein